MSNLLDLLNKHLENIRDNSNILYDTDRIYNEAFNHKLLLIRCMLISNNKFTSSTVNHMSDSRDLSTSLIADMSDTLSNSSSINLRFLEILE